MLISYSIGTLKEGIDVFTRNMLMKYGECSQHIPVVLISRSC